jgi:hypothetical protein
VDWVTGALGAVAFVLAQPVASAAAKAPSAITRIPTGIDRVMRLTVYQVKLRASPENEVVPAMKHPIIF